MSESNLGEVEATLVQLIEEFRSRSNELSEEELEMLSNSGDFREPCQLELFWMNDPFDCQLLVKTRDENRDDKEIIINGPFTGPEFVQKVEKILDEPRWQQLVEDSIWRPTSSTDIIKRKDQITPVIRRFVTLAQSTIFHSYPSKLGTGMALSKTNWSYQINGNITTHDINTFIDQRINEVQTRVSKVNNTNESQPQVPKTESSENDSDESGIQGYSVHIYEPVWIGEQPKKSFQEVVFNRTSHNRDLEHNTSFDGRALRAYRDGRLFVEEENPGKAVEIFNTLFGTAMFYGFRWQAVQKKGVQDTKVDEEGGSISRSSTLSMPRAILDMPDGESLSFMPPRKEISIDEFKAIVEKSEKIFQEPQLRDKIIFALQAFTHHLNGEHSQAFLLNWILIEQHLSQVLNRHLKEENNVNNDRRSKITDSAHWYASHKIEVLEIVGAIDGVTYEEIDRFRKRRNEIVHNMETASEQESKDMLKLALDFINDDAPGSFTRVPGPSSNLNL